MILTIVILSVLLLASIGLNFYFSNKLLNAISSIEENQQFINKIAKEVDSTYKQLKYIDDRQMFEKDDDVGFVFTNIVDLIDQLNQKI
jgi:hypothetical protein